MSQLLADPSQQSHDRAGLPRQGRLHGPERRYGTRLDHDRQVAVFVKGLPGPNEPLEQMKHTIHSAEGRRHYDQRIGTIEPVFGNLRHDKRLNRLTQRGRKKVATQWQLRRLVHNIKKIVGR